MSIIVFNKMQFQAILLLCTVCCVYIIGSFTVLFSWCTWVLYSIPASYLFMYEFRVPLMGACPKVAY